MKSAKDQVGKVISIKVSNYYSAGHDKGLFWNDSALGIEWRVAEDEAILSDKDKVRPHLAELSLYFHSDLEHAR
jgi:dTDP-4-dehydrorhamnose 3,5-epimerase